MRLPIALALLTLSLQVCADESGAGGPTGAAHAPASAYRPLNATEDATFRRGRELFAVHWVAAGTTDADGHGGLGPLFNANACESCHPGAGRGEGPAGDGPVPAALVVKLEAPVIDRGREPVGDPVYGRIFNTQALTGVPAEGVVVVKYREITGNYYPGGGYWRMREPTYHLTELRYGPLASTTVIKPRLAPPLFGVGYLAAVPDSFVDGEAKRASPTSTGQQVRASGRFGWQGDVASLRDQTTKAFALEMGLTSSDRPADDCTPVQVDCARSPRAGSPEVPDESLAAIVEYLQLLAPPPARPISRKDETGRRVFSQIGCGACHLTELGVELRRADGTPSTGLVAAYTDLRRHDLGRRMADRDASGHVVPTLWRTAPLWGLGLRSSTGRDPTFLHDGRARTIEEAVLWHLGEAADAGRRFRELSPGRRDDLLRWLASR